MKYISILIIVLLMSSCSAKKQVIDNSKKEISKVEISEAQTDVKPVIESVVRVEKTEQEVVEVEVLEQETQVKPITVIESKVENTSEVFSHSSWNDLLQNHVSEAGNVNYKAFKSDRKALTNYITSLSKNMPLDSWSKNEKLAYWINAYNAMTVDLILRHYPVNSIKDIDKPWEQRYWKLGEKWFNLDEIEHQILRKMNEPRIHFAIVCASFSCPKLQNEAFTASNLEAQLTEATKGFLSDNNRNEITSEDIKISKIFQWFSKDFTENGSLIDFLNQYSDIQISAKAKKSYLKYNWDLNE